MLKPQPSAIHEDTEQIEVWRGQLDAAVDALRPCRRLLVLVGAGGSADAGVPTFRDEGGWWRDHKPEDLAHPTAFRDHPQVVWEWYEARRQGIVTAVPHAGQRALALLQRHFPAGEVLIATTNEDDLLQRAGVDPVTHLHGSIFSTRCADGCGWSVDVRREPWARLPCPHCGAAVRPGSVWFGEPLPGDALASIGDFDADGCLVIGSSCLVAPVSQIPLDMALSGLPVVEVNPQRTPLTERATPLAGTARQVLPSLVDLLTSSTMRDQRLRTDGG